MSPPVDDRAPLASSAERARRRRWSVLLVAGVRSPWPRLGLFLLLLGASGGLAATHGAGMLTAARTAITGMGPL
jgi:hypothetical protein